YLTNSTQRFIQKMSELNKLQTATLRFFRGIIKKLPAEHQLAYREFEKELQALARDKFEKRAFLYLDIVSWVRSKLKEEDMRSIVRQRFLKA
ncbi:MAG: hypothetical protein AAFO94_20010, partial [Bacteroidota bacterium]